MPYNSKSPPAIPTAGVQSALAQADALCRQRGLRLTDLRRRVLEIVADSGQPIGAYQILEILSREKGRAAPPTVYRALDFLLAEGLVHRLVSISAYQLCHQPDGPHKAQFWICRQCGDVAEVADDRIEQAVARAASAAGFQVETQTIEITGQCQQCQQTLQQPG